MSSKFIKLTDEDGFVAVYNPYYFARVSKHNTGSSIRIKGEVGLLFVNQTPEEIMALLGQSNHTNKQDCACCGLPLPVDQTCATCGPPVNYFEDAELERDQWRDAAVELAKHTDQFIRKGSCCRHDLEKATRNIQHLDDLGLPLPSLQSGEQKANTEPLQKTQQLQGVDREKVMELLSSLKCRWAYIFDKSRRLHAQRSEEIRAINAFDAVAECLREGGE